MKNTSEAFVYGATGYTGRLICHELKKRGIAFTIGGRNLRRLETFRDELKDRGIKVVEATHDVEALTHAFRGHRVVINATGPFSLLGEIVVKAALAAEVHYLDTTGEQDFMLLVKERYDKLAKELGKVVINANSWYYSLGETASLYLKEKFPELDTFGVFYCPNGKPTVASLQSILRTARRPGFSYVDGKLEPNRKISIVNILVPEEVVFRKAIIIPGGEVLHFASEPGVKDVKVYMSSELVPAIYPFFKLWLFLSRIFGGILDTLGDKLISLFYRNPPPEDPARTRFVVMVAAEAERSRKICVLFGSKPYVVTGFLCAEATERLLTGKFRRSGVISTPQAFGAKEILEALQNAGVSYRVYE